MLATFEERLKKFEQRKDAEFQEKLDKRFAVAEEMIVQLRHELRTSSTGARAITSEEQRNYQGEFRSSDTDSKGKGKGKSSNNETGRMPSTLHRDKRYEGCCECKYRKWQSRSKGDHSWEEVWKWIWDNPQDQDKRLSSMVHCLSGCYMLGWTDDEIGYHSQRLLDMIGGPERYSSTSEPSQRGWMMTHWKAHQWVMIGCVHCGHFNELKLPRDDPSVKDICDHNTAVIIQFFEDSVRR
jgi:hypothetical protein